MHTHTAGGSNRPHTSTFIHRRQDQRATARKTRTGTLTVEDLRLLVAAMVD
jgi:hypothetical protein